MNEYNEKVIKDALTLLRAEEDKKLLQEMEEAKKIPELQVKRGEAERFVKQHSRSANHRPWLRAASIILVVALSVSVVTISVDAFREMFTSFFTNFVSSDYAGVKVGSEDDLFLEYNGQFIPSVLPEGYEVVSVVNATDRCELVLESENGCMIVIKEQSSDLKSNIDTEDADAVKEVEINEMKGIYVAKDNNERIALHNDEVMLYLCDDDCEMDLIGFAELLEKR